MKSSENNTILNLSRYTYFLQRFCFPDSDDMLSKDLSPVINAMVDGLLSANPKQIYYKGFLARSLPFLYFHLPRVLRGPVMGVLADWFEFHPACLEDDQS